MLLYSLKNQKDFNLVNLQGRKFSSQYFMLIIAKILNPIQTNIEKSTFLGMKVSKKVSKKACVRNKIKRRIRHLVNLAIKEHKHKEKLSGLTMVFIPYKNFDTVDFSKLKNEFECILYKVES